MNRPLRPPPELDTKHGMVINCAAYQGGCRVADIDLDQAREVDTRDGRFVWIGLHEPDQALLHTVQQRFGLHDLAIEDALRAHQRPKLEIYGDTLFIVVRTASLHDRKVRFGETHIFAGRGYVVTVRHGSTTAYKEVRSRCEGAPKMLAMGEGFVVYSIMDFIVDNYFPILQELESEVDSLEETIFSRTQSTECGADLRRPTRIASAASCGPAAAGDVQSHDAVRRAADRSGHASLLSRHSRPCDPPGREHRRPPGPSGGGLGGTSATLVG
jgi:magnesium transporter